MFSHYRQHEWKSIISLSAGWALDDNLSLFDHDQCHREETRRALGAVILGDGARFPAFLWYTAL